MEGFRERLLAFLHVKEEELPALLIDPWERPLPLKMGEGASFRRAREVLEEAHASKGKALVYGDYDVDGAMGASILLRALRELGIESRGYLPTRYKDGYGLTVENARKIAQAGYSLLFLVDNGVSQHAAIQEARSLGLKVLVLDHHTPPESLPECEGILHPVLDGYPEPQVSAGFYSYVFAANLLEREDPYLESLAALSVLSDLMPLRGPNRQVVRRMLHRLEEGEPPEILRLMEKEGRSEEDVAIEVNGKINAVGRLDEEGRINRLLTYFADRRNEEAIALFLKETNEERKRLAQEAALSIPPSQGIGEVHLLPVKDGLSGLIASRLLEERGVPVAIFARRGDILVGSLRTGGRMDAVSFLRNMERKPLAFGGHKGAAGCSIRPEDLEEFRKEFLFEAGKYLLGDKPMEEPSLPMSLREANGENARLIRSLSPYGEGWRNPLLRIEGVPANSLSFVKEGKYLSTPLEGARLFSFRLGIKDFRPGERVALLARAREERFRGSLRYTYLAEKILREG